jgi:oligoendopeptidase F
MNARHLFRAGLSRIWPSSALPARRKESAQGKDSDPQENVAPKDILPRWDLSHLYPSPESDEMQADQAKADGLAEILAINYSGAVARLTGDELGQAIAAFEEVETIRNRISCYLYLYEQEDSRRLPQTEELHQWLGDLWDKMSFFAGELAAMKEQDLMPKLASPDLAKYAPWLARLRVGNEYLMPVETMETVSADLAEVNISAWHRYYTEMMASIRIDVDDKTRLTLADVSEHLLNPDLSMEAYDDLRQKITQALHSKSHEAALIYNTVMQDILIDAAARGYPRPEYEANVQNGVDGNVVDVMHDTVKKSYLRLSHRFYRWKASHDDDDALMKNGDDPARCYTWDQAKKTVLRAFKRFSPRFEKVARRFFDDKHIDALPRDGKAEGGFSLPTGGDRFPYILLNYRGTADDVAAGLGHELGHGVHQHLAETARGCLLSEMPTAVAETASIFAEMLVFDEMLRGERSAARRQAMLSDKIEGMLNNSLRQLSYYDFERRAFEERGRGEVSTERLCDIWLDTQNEYFGPAKPLDEHSRYGWMTIPHLFETPFYVYSYSFAQIMVCALYQAYKNAADEGEEVREAFVQRYVELLETGITRNLSEMFRPFGLDPETAAFWQEGLAMIEGYIDALENGAASTPSLRAEFASRNHPSPSKKEQKSAASKNPPRRKP